MAILLLRRCITEQNECKYISHALRPGSQYALKMDRFRLCEPATRFPLQVLPGLGLLRITDSMRKRALYRNLLRYW